MAKARKKTTKTRKKKSSKTPLNWFLAHWKLLAASAFLVVFIVVSLNGLRWLQEQYAPPASTPSSPPVAQPAPPTPPPVAQLPKEDVRVEVESLLLRCGVSNDRVKQTAVGPVVFYEVAGTYPEAELLQIFNRRLNRLSPRLQMAHASSKSTIQLFWDRELRYQLHFVPPVSQPETYGPRVAIIMDDLGQQLSAAKTLVGIELKVTGAVIPDTPYAIETARLLNRYGREVMIHIPMQPKSYPTANPGPNALLEGQTEDEIRRRMNHLLSKVPHALGGNNHMGSAFTELQAPMAVVMQELKRRNLFFVDSMTSANSVGLAEARRAGLKTVGRDIFLDNTRDVGAIRKQLRRLIRMARERGQAVGICHPYPETLEALAYEAEAFRQMGVEVVYASDLTS